MNNCDFQELLLAPSVRRRAPQLLSLFFLLLCCVHWRSVYAGGRLDRAQCSRLLPLLLVRGIMMLYLSNPVPHTTSTASKGGRLNERVAGEGRREDIVIVRRAESKKEGSSSSL